MLKFFNPAIAWLLLSVFLSDLVLGGELEDLIQTVLKVDKGGAGHAAAVPALKQLCRQPVTALIPILRGMDLANPLAENWLRGAFEQVADRSRKVGEPLPKDDFETFAIDRARGVQARKLAFEWLLKIDPGAADRLVPGMIDDPGAEFRREAVQRLLDAAGALAESDVTATKDLFRQAFAAALDPDQLEASAQALTKLGEKPDLKRQLGLLDGWWLIGPFDNHDKIGFDAAYPPEKELDLQQQYVGKEGEVTWIKKESDHGHAVMDLNKVIGVHKGAVVYAYREFESNSHGPVEIRLGTPNGWKLWINGQEVFAHQEYHMTMRMDQYRVPAAFKTGTNRILLKVCQDEQSAEWAQRWQFQVRVCDASGKAVRPADMSAAQILDASPK